VPSAGHIALEPLTEADIGPLIPVMVRAFDDDTRRHTGKSSGGPPGYDDGTFLRTYALREDSDAFTVRVDGEIGGAVIIFPGDDQSCYLGNIFIDTRFQGAGVGTRVWQEVESRYPETSTWRTATPGFSKRNHHFYVRKCGFEVDRVTDAGDPERESYHLVKHMKRTATSPSTPVSDGPSPIE
jgi:GNAT superfamily N-acetyltransferase